MSQGIRDNNHGSRCCGNTVECTYINLGGTGHSVHVTFDKIKIHGKQKT